jgi:squalene-associated FAD-dependent desaturase
MSAPAVHVVGAGLSGLAAAIRLAEAGTPVRLYEAAGQAGGRCRSYYDATLKTTIDNGNHLVLSGNRATLDYLRRVGADHRLTGPPVPEFAFADLATGGRWSVKPSPGRVPWWIFDARRRVPDTRTLEYLAVVRLLRAKPGDPIAAVMDCTGRLYERLWRPVLLAALNTEPSEASATLAAAVMRETLLAGGHACRPLVASDGLGATFVDPALGYLGDRGARIQFGRRLRAITFEAGRADALDFGEGPEGVVRLGKSEAVVLALPPWVATTLLPGIQAPTEFRGILNAHFLIEPPASLAPITGIINGVAEWIFAFHDRLSVTVSGADRLIDMPREKLAHDIWQDVAAAAGLAGDLPPWQIIKERRATFAALPREDAKRPPAATAWSNVLLAGDWTATGLPATIEGAIRSGDRAAALARAAME